MTKIRHIVAVGTVAVMAAWALAGAGLSAEDPHHPAGQAAPSTRQAQTGPNAAEQPGMAAGQGMTGMGGMMSGMPMMNMMGMMQMMGGGDGPGMGMIDHVEGRIAFLRTELKITDAQQTAWNAFAAALRTNAQTLGTARRTMMGRGQQQPQTLVQRLDAQERWLSARLEGTRSLKAAFTGLYAGLSEEQKKTADELLAPHMGVGMGPMGMMAMRGGAQ